MDEAVDFGDRGRGESHGGQPGDECGAAVPVVVLTTSDSPTDVAACYGLHANAFVTKRRDFDEFEMAVARIGEFFGGVAVRPHLE